MTELKNKINGVEKDGFVVLAWVHHNWPVYTETHVKKTSRLFVSLLKDGQRIEVPEHKMAACLSWLGI